MVKISSLVLPCIILGSASAFAPSHRQTFVAKPLFAEVEEASEPAVEEAEPVAKAGALVPIKEDTVEFTAGLIGGAVGFAVGGPVLGAFGAAAANYAAKSDQEAGEIVQAVSKSSIEVYNYLATLDAKYELLESTKKSLEESLEKIKSSGSVNPETVKKVEDALSSTTAKISEINEEYDLVGVGSTALGVIGELVERAIKKAGELNEEYQLSDKALSAVSSSVEKAKDAAAKAKN